MSKQPTRKNETTTRATISPKPTQSATSNGRPETTTVTAKSTVRPAQGAATTRRPATPAKKSGFKLRPLDMALLVVGLLVVAGIVWGGLSGANKNLASLDPNKPVITYLPIGSAAPDFSLPGADGKTHSLSENKGKVVMVEFMAPWCPHCQDDAPAFNKIYEDYKDKAVQAFGVSATDKGKDHTSPIAMEDMTWFRDTYKVPYPLLLDKPLKVSDAYLIKYFPTVYVIDKKGNVAAGLNADPDNPIELDKRIVSEIDKALNQQ